MYAKRYMYWIKFGSEKCRNEMEALELRSVDEAMDWVEESIIDDASDYLFPISTNYLWADDEYAAVFIACIDEHQFDGVDMKVVFESDLSVVSEIVSCVEV